MILTIQYLEDGPGVAAIAPADAAARLRGAFAHLPLTHVSPGWDLLHVPLERLSLVREMALDA